MGRLVPKKEKKVVASFPAIDTGTGILTNYVQVPRWKPVLPIRIRMDRFILGS